jgi:hypothetical protein
MTTLESSSLENSRMNEKVTTRNPAPDLFIPDAHTSFMVGHTMRTWEAGDLVTHPADIAALSHAKIPGKRYELLSHSGVHDPLKPIDRISR